MLQAAEGAERQPRISRGQPDDVRSACRELQAGKNVVAFQIRKVGKNFTCLNTIAQHFQNVVDAYAHAAYARAPTAFAGFDGNSIKQIRFQGRLPDLSAARSMPFIQFQGKTQSDCDGV